PPLRAVLSLHDALPICRLRLLCWGVGSGGPIAVQPAQDSLLELVRIALRLGWLRIRLVVQGEVVEDVLTGWMVVGGAVHPAQPVDRKSTRLNSSHVSIS